jgi:hypothetical protein
MRISLIGGDRLAVEERKGEGVWAVVRRKGGGVFHLGQSKKRGWRAGLSCCWACGNVREGLEPSGQNRRRGDFPFSFLFFSFVLFLFFLFQSLFKAVSNQFKKNILTLLKFTQYKSINAPA